MMVCLWGGRVGGRVCTGPSKGLQGLVEKLRLQLTEKEKQLEGLRKALHQVKSDLAETAQKTFEV